MSLDKIQEIENQFFEALQEEDDFGEELICKSYFMPYGDAQKRNKLLIPKVPVRLSPLLTEFYQITNGLQFVWEYKKLPNYEKLKSGYHHISRYTQSQQVVDWNRWNAIDHHWAVGSVFILPLQNWLTTGIEVGNFLLA
ncbi:MAG: hypothetical protein HC913_14520 [Microscillaceae bacterium]|nr:hypothetical protein [Microscillaceae bacterium]